MSYLDNKDWMDPNLDRGERKQPSKAELEEQEAKAARAQGEIAHIALVQAGDLNALAKQGERDAQKEVLYAEYDEAAERAENDPQIEQPGQYDISAD